MTNEHEEKTITSFMLKHRRQRYLFLLSNKSEERRWEALNKLNHCQDFDPRFAKWLSSKVDVAESLLAEGSPSQVYVMSVSESIDGKTMNLNDAIYETTRCGWGTIISCIPGKLAYYYDEEGKRRAILKRTQGISQHNLSSQGPVYAV